MADQLHINIPEDLQRICRLVGKEYLEIRLVDLVDLKDRLRAKETRLAEDIDCVQRMERLLEFRRDQGGQDL